MDQVLIEPAARAQDVTEALALAWESFAARTPTSSGIAYKETLWYADPTYSPDNIIVARGAGGKIVAVVRLVPRVVTRGGLSYSVAGISSVCVAEEVRGTGVAASTMTAALDVARQRGFDLAFLFARKALDGYYARFGFHGLSAYSRMVVHLPAAEAPSPAVSLAPARWLDVPSYARAYDHSYEACFGRVERSAAYWAFVREKLQLLPGTAMLDILVQERWCGYAIVGGGIVHELAATPEFPAEAIGGLMHSLAALANARSVELAVAPQHAVVPLLGDFDTVSTRRQCVYGGHMGALLNLDAVLQKFSSRLADALGAIGAKPMQRDLGGVRVRWSGQGCECELTTGKPSYADTCTLLGTADNSRGDADLERALPLNIALCDQF